MRIRWVGISVAMLVNCGDKEPPALEKSVRHIEFRSDGEIDKASPMPYPNVFLPTEKLITDPIVRGDVDQLAARHSIESRAVGYGGSTSKSWLAYRKMVADASSKERLALLMHQSPVVRGYMAEYIAVRMPADSEHVYTLLADATPVDTLSGCVGQEESVALRAFAAMLPDEKDKRRGPYLVRVASDEHLTFAVRAQAVSLLAEDKRPDAHRFASIAISSSDEQLRGAGLRALGQTAQSQDLEQLAVFARSPDAKAREDAAKGLGSIGSPQACELLETLFGDPDPEVRRYALRAYAENGAADLAKIRALLTDTQTWFEIVYRVAERGTEETFDILEPALMTGAPPMDSDSISNSVRGLAKSAGVRAIPKLRKLLDSRVYQVRGYTMDTLADVRDKTSIPAIRALLRRKELWDVEHASRALVKLDAKEAIPDLLPQLKHDNPHARIAAANALVAFHARSAIPALEAAVALENGWSKEKLSSALQALKRGDELPP
ncbi:HEAT repeat domain-containing protein [Pendulispora rubella]|uniref:HEAT repeat domain-containing protein n=1 Tax=Pendulispora rubella TaxID=2741070 RepID=A0ABZ2KWD7_9BACT